MTSFTTYFIFDGNARQAIEFYAKCFEAELEMHTFGSANSGAPPEASERIMHARLSKGKALLMASDNMPGMPYTAGNNFAVSVECESRAEVDKLFAALSEGGSVTMAVAETFWGAYFGMAKDRFGVHWMFNYALPKS